MSDPEKSPNVQSLRNREFYRARTLGQPRRMHKEIVELPDGTGEPLPFEFRTPTLARKTAIQEAATKINTDPSTPSGIHVEVNRLELAVGAAIECTFVPGTDEHIFEPGDADRLRNAYATGGWEEKVMENAVRVMNGPKPEEIAKNSEATAPASSSSK